MKYLVIIGIVLVSLGGGGILFAWSGIYNIADTWSFIFDLSPG